MNKSILLFPLLFLPLVACSTSPNGNTEPGESEQGGDSGEGHATVFEISVSSWEEADSSHITRISNGFTFTTNGASNSGMITDGALRVYATCTLTISSSYTMNKFVFDCASKVDKKEYKWGAGELSTTTGTYTYNDDETVGTWVGSSNSIIFNTEQQARIKTFTITINK